MNEASWHESPGPPEMRYFPAPRILAESASSVPPDCSAELSNDGSRIHSVLAAFLVSAFCCILNTVFGTSERLEKLLCLSCFLIILAVFAQVKAPGMEENCDSGSEEIALCFALFGSAKIACPLQLP